MVASTLGDNQSKAVSPQDTNNCWPLFLAETSIRIWKHLVTNGWAECHDHAHINQLSDYKALDNYRGVIVSLTYAWRVISHLDQWVLQVRSGDHWVAEFYCPTKRSLCRAIRENVGECDFGDDIIDTIAALPVKHP